MNEYGRHRKRKAEHVPQYEDPSGKLPEYNLLLKCFQDIVAEELETPLVVALAATALILLHLILTRGNPMAGERGRLLTFLWLMLAAMAVTVQCETGALLATFVLAVQVVAALWLDSKNVLCPGTAGGICIQ